MSLFNGAVGERNWLIRQNLSSYLELFKLKQTALLITTGILGYLIASNGRVEGSFYRIILSLSLAIAGTTGLNMYFDRDIDSAMFRTKKRPIPSRKIFPMTAFFLSSLLLFAGIILAFGVNLTVGGCVVSGFFIDLILYTLLLKRKTIFNIIVGSLAGGMPAVAGYSAFSGRIDFMGFSLLLLVSLWSMGHIWLISSYYIEDYKRAKIPTLPLTHGVRFTVKVSFVILLTINLLILLLSRLGEISTFPALFSFSISLPIAGFLLSYLKKERKSFLKIVFRLFSSYLGLIFLFIFVAKVWL